MTRTMYDSVTATDIPKSATMVAGYLAPSRFAWSAADWARFPKAVKVRIAIFASVNDGHVLDVEPGDATPAQAPRWVTMRRKAGVDPSVYCNASTWPVVRAEFTRQGVAQPHYWIAKYDGVATIPTGAVAKQYADPPVHGAGHFDLSVVANYWPGVDAPPSEGFMPALTPAEQEDLYARVKNVETKVKNVESFVEPGDNWTIRDQWLQKALSDMQRDNDQTKAALAAIAAQIEALSSAQG